MNQHYTSAATSINKTKLPAVYQKIAVSRDDMVFDYGCGKYTNHIANSLPGVLYCPYDPFNQPMERNQLSMYFLRLAKHVKRPVTVVCSNVLNVIDSEIEIRGILANIASIVHHTTGKAYITVYEGDRSGIGKQTGKDSWQRNEKLSNYLRFMPEGVKARISKGMIIIEKEA